jgi:hypothetical protein
MAVVLVMQVMVLRHITRTFHLTIDTVKLLMRRVSRIERLLGLISDEDLTIDEEMKAIFKER